MNRGKSILTLSIVMFICMLLISGSTFAFLSWQTSTSQQTLLNVVVSDDINMTIDAATISSNKMYPSSDCDEAAGMQGTSYVTIVNNTGILAAPKFKLKVKIEDKDGNIITGDDATGNDHEYRYYIKYAVAEADGSCSLPLYSGRFDVDEETILNSGWYDSSWITLEDENSFPLPSTGPHSGVSFNAPTYQTTTHSYKIWAWIDKEYTSLNEGTTSLDKLQDATVTVSWSNNSTVEQKRNELIAYAVYSSQDSSLRFYDTTDLIEEGTTYNNLTASNVYEIYANDSYSYNSETTRTTSPWDGHRDNVTKVIVEDEISPISTANWFYSFTKVSSVDVTKLNTSNVTDMDRMFARTGADSSVTSFAITGLDNFNTSNVTNMYGMFNRAGHSATTWNIGDLSNWDTSNVTSMRGMFALAGYSATTFDIGNLLNWDTSKVTDMCAMFEYAGYIATTWSIGNLSNWDTSQVTDMSGMFENTGENATTWSIGNLSNWDTSNVTGMKAMFEYAGKKATTWNIGNLSNWNVSKVTNMQYMFNQSGQEATTWNVGDLSNWDTSKVTNMSAMFSKAGSKTASFNIGNLSNWNVSSVTDMSFMFNKSGEGATTWNVGDLSNWNVSKVTNMSAMFQTAGANSTTFNIGNLSNWNVSNVTDMQYMFNKSGEGATTWNVGNLSNWNVSKVTNMKAMFSEAGASSTNTWSLDLSQWNVCKVTEYDSFVESNGAGVITEPSWGMSCPTA